LARTAKLYTYPGVYIEDLRPLDMSVTVDRNSPYRRTANFTLAIEDLPKVNVLGQQAKLLDGAAPLFGGFIDTARSNPTPSGGSVSVSCSDRTKIFKLARFPADTAYEDLDARETPTLISNAAGSSELAPGGEIQSSGSIYKRVVQVYVPDSPYGWVTVRESEIHETGSILTGNYTLSVTQPVTIWSSGGSVINGYYSEITVTLYVDLGVSTDVDIVVATTNGTATSYTSTNGTTWAAYAATTTWRYLKLELHRHATSLTGGVVMTATGTYAASRVLTDGTDFWMPATTDIADRYITFTLLSTVTVTSEAVGTGDGATTIFVLDWFPITDHSEVIYVDAVAKTRGVDYSEVSATGTITFLAGKIPTQGQLITANYTFPTLGRNVLYLRWGTSDADRTTRLVYDIQTSADNVTYTTVISDAHATPNYLAEHLLTLSTNLYLRVKVKKCNGAVALRYAKVQYIDSSNDIGTIIQTIAGTEGETSFDFATTRQYRSSITAAQGDEKWGTMESLAQSIGCELFYSATEVLTFRLAEDLDITDTSIPTYETLLSMDAEYSDAGIYNRIIAVYEDAGATYRFVALNDAASSPTGTPNIGTRTSPVFKSATANSQQKVEAWARYLLTLYSRRTIKAEISKSAVNSLEPGDVVHLHESKSGVNGNFIMESYTLTDNGREYDIRASVSEV